MIYTKSSLLIYFILFIYFYFFGHATRRVESSFPDQGLNLYPLLWKHRILTTGQPGKSWLYHSFNISKKEDSFFIFQVFLTNNLYLKKKKIIILSLPLYRHWVCKGKEKCPSLLQCLSREPIASFRLKVCEMRSLKCFCTKGCHHLWWLSGHLPYIRHCEQHNTGSAFFLEI